MSGAAAVLLPLALVWGLAVMVPGPNFLAIVYAAVTRGRRAGVMTALGSLSGTVFWVAAGLLGLNALFTLLPFAGNAIKLVGAVYLVWTGIQMIRGAGRPAVQAGSLGSAYRTGLATTLSNPKSAAVAASLLAVALPAEHSMWLTLKAFLMLLVISSGWYLPLAVIASTGVMSRIFTRFQKPLKQFAGAIFILFGIGLGNGALR